MPGEGAQNGVRVREVQGGRDLARFIDLPYRRYRNDPHWVPPLRLAEKERFNPRKNPFYEHAVIDLFLAERGDRVVGRIAAIDDDNHNAAHGDNLAFFGFFEADDEAVAGALLERVEAWARARGRSAVRGPANPSMNDGSGFQLDAFDTDPYLMMPSNPPEYPRYAEAAGYTKVKDLYAWFFSHRSADVARLARLAARVEKRYRPTVRTADMRRFDDELQLVKRLYNGAWEENWGFVRYTEAEFDALARELKLIIDPNIVIFIELGGEVVGLALSLPNANQVFKRMKGRLLPFGWLHYLRRKRIITQGRLPILGVVKEHRNKGLELVLIHETMKRSLAAGYVEGECSWILEDNDAMNKGIEAAGATLYKTYRLYQKNL
jgi:GNAT superfamily N-acetyltransferase